MPTIEFYANEIAAKKKIINQVITNIGMSEDAENILLCIKAIESMEYVDRYPEFIAAVEAIAQKIVDMDLSLSTGKDLTLLSRALKLREIPIGNEDRWLQLTQDDRNVDVFSNIVVGDRTLESYDDKILETYYAVSL